jgi:Holliday junction DNA helicase RuvA
MFLKLISVSGVGPKMGITILSNMEIGELAIKIATSDIKGLSSVKGLGKKTAERIIVELREKVDAEATLEKTDKSERIELSKEDDDAVYALLSLGFTKSECVDAVKKAKEQGANSIEQIISFALKNIR